MKYPAIIIFNDFTVNIVKNEHAINRNVNWSDVNYEKEDIIIDFDHNVFRFVSNDSDKTFGELKDSNIISADLSNDELKNLLKKAREKLKKLEPEKKLLNEILAQLEKKE